MITYVGVTDYTASTGAPVISVPTSIAGDLLLLSVHSANEAVATPSGWNLVGTPYGNGTAGGIGAVRLTQFWKIQSGSDTSVTVADSGNITGGSISAWRGINQTNPIGNIAGGFNTTASTSITIPGITLGEDQLVIWTIALDRDANSTTDTGTLTHSTISDPIEIVDRITNAGAGGGIAQIYSPTIQNAGTLDSATISMTSGLFAYSTLAIRPDSIDLAGSASISTTAQASINTQIRFSTSASIITSVSGNLITPEILLAANASLSLNASSSLSTSIRLAANSICSFSTSASLSTSIRLSSAAPVSVTVPTANLSTAINLAGTAPISISAVPALKSYASLSSTANIAITGSATLYSYNTFSSTANLYFTSSANLTNGIRLAGSANNSINVVPPILGSYNTFSGSASIGVSVTPPILSNQSVFYASATLGFSASGSVLVGANFSSTAVLGIGASGVMVPDWQPSNIAYDGGKLVILEAGSRSWNFDAGRSVQVFEPVKGMTTDSGTRSFRFEVSHLYSWNSPINRLD